MSGRRFVAKTLKSHIFNGLGRVKYVAQNIRMLDYHHADDYLFALCYRV